MSEKGKSKSWSEEFWYSGKVTRRRLLGWSATGAGAIGATMLVPAPWRAAFGQAKPYKIGSLQPLSGASCFGWQDRSGRHPDGRRSHQQERRHQWPTRRADRRRLQIEARRRPPQGREADRRRQHRRAPGRLPFQRVPCLHAGVRRGQDRQHDRRVPRHDDHRQQMRSPYLRTFDYAPAAGRGHGALLDGKLGKRWHIVYADYSWGQSTKDAYADEIKKPAVRLSAPPASRSAPPT